jgi:hypothetical protein
MSRQRREHEPFAEAWGRVPGVRRGRLTDAEIVYLELFLPEPQYITERHVIPLLAPHLQVRYVAGRRFWFRAADPDDGRHNRGVADKTRR